MMSFAVSRVQAKFGFAYPSVLLVTHPILVLEGNATTSATGELAVSVLPGFTKAPD